MGKILYASDLDGTLLNGNACLSDFSAKKYRELVEKGVLLTFITARTPATIEPILAKAHPTLPGVAMTGAAIWNPAKRTYESVVYHAPEDALLIAEICRNCGVTPFVYTLPKGTNSMVVYHEAECLSDVESKFVSERTINDLKTFHLSTKAPERFENETVLYFAMGEPEKIKVAAEAIRQATDCYASWYPDTYNPGLSLLEVFAPGVSKAAGLNKLKKMLGADKVVAFGDNLNDIPMLQAADWSVAVANAHDEVKEVADEVIPECNQDSVVKYIEKQSQESR